MPCSPDVDRASVLGARPSVLEVVVAVPVRNEAARVSECLSSLSRAIEALAGCNGRQFAPRVRTVVVLDSCSDRTAEVVAGFPWVHAVPANLGRVGAARSVAVRQGLGLSSELPARTWIVNTDADSRVPQDWLTHQLWLADLGADVVCGLVDPDPAECGPTRYAAWLAAYLRMDGHPHVHGANLGVRGDCYLDCGGFSTGRLAHEDVSLVRSAEARGWHVVASRGATVRTSGRTEGRVQLGGFAGYLRACVRPDPEPMPALREASA
jgi:glycosyltransferase involved in cell wall biosynthesis